MTSHLKIPATGGLIVLFASKAYQNLKDFYGSISVPEIYHKDFLNHYVLGAAALRQLNPYETISNLAATMLGPLQESVFPHPSPYPPPSILIFLPVGGLSYPQAVAVWHTVQLLCLLLTAYLFTKHLTIRAGLAVSLLAGLLAFGIDSVSEDFLWGNVMIVLLAPLTLSWLCLRSNKPILGGLLLGFVVALKFIAWPLMVLLVIKKAWKAAITSITTIIIANTLAVVLIGPGPVAYYYREVPAQVMPLYRARIDNFSLHSVGWRFFEGTQSPIFNTPTVDPLIYAPRLAIILSFCLPLAALILAFYLAQRTIKFDLAFALVLCISIVIGPLAWRPYLAWLVLPLVIAATSCKWNRSTFALASIAGLILFLYPNPLIAPLASFFSADTAAPFPVSLFSFLPLGGVFCVFALLGLQVRAAQVSMPTTQRLS